MTDSHQAIEELRLIVEAAAEYRAAQDEWVAGLNAQKAGHPPSPAESDAVHDRLAKATEVMLAASGTVGMGTPRSYPGPMCLFVNTYVAPLLAAYDTLLGVAEAAQIVSEDDEWDGSRCPWYRRLDKPLPGFDPDAICGSGCDQEPMCKTGEPTEGWPLANLTAALATWRRATEREEGEGT